MKPHRYALIPSLVACALMILCFAMLTACTATNIMKIQPTEKLKEADCVNKVPFRLLVIGKEFPPTATIDVFYDSHEITAAQYEFCC